MARRQAHATRYAGDPPLISPEGDCAVRVQFGTTIDPGVNRQVHAFCRAVAQASIAGVMECVPSYCVATVYYQPSAAGYEDLRKQLSALLASPGAQDIPHGLVEIPVVYGGEFGPDLSHVASRLGLTENGLVAHHSAHDYLCYMVGFMPGFPYLGELPAELRLPRRETPRVRVPAGSVAIADAQTGIYPQESPGGWHLIGRTPLRLFDPGVDPPTIVQAGDYVRFAVIDAPEFRAIEHKVRSGQYTVKRMAYEG